MAFFPTVETAAPLIGLVSRINRLSNSPHRKSCSGRPHWWGMGQARPLPNPESVHGCASTCRPGVYPTMSSCCNAMYSYYHCQYGGALVKCWLDNGNPPVPVSPSASGQVHIARDLSCGRLSTYYVLSVRSRGNPSSSSSGEL